MSKPTKFDAAIIDLAGVPKRSEKLLVPGRAVDIDVLKTPPRIETRHICRSSVVG